MSAEALETMLKQQQPQEKASKSVFRAIVDGEIPSKKVDENEEAVAVVSVRPVSKGHVLVIPKKAITSANDIPKSAFSMAKKIAKKIGPNKRVVTILCDTGERYFSVEQYFEA